MGLGTSGGLSAVPPLTALPGAPGTIFEVVATKPRRFLLQALAAAAAAVASGSL